jgi:hypothetical protein
VGSASSAAGSLGTSASISAKAGTSVSGAGGSVSINGSTAGVGSSSTVGLSGATGISGKSSESHRLATGGKRKSVREYDSDSDDVFESSSSSDDDFVPSRVRVSGPRKATQSLRTGHGPLSPGALKRQARARMSRLREDETELQRAERISNQSSRMIAKRPKPYIPVGGDIDSFRIVGMYQVVPRAISLLVHECSIQFPRMCAPYARRSRSRHEGLSARLLI